MNGQELYTKIAEERPEVKVLYMSGYADNAIAHHGVLTEEIAFIRKPFGVRDLLGKVRKIMDRDITVE